MAFKLQFKHLYFVLDLLSMVGLFYGGIDVYIHFDDYKVQDCIWAIYYMLFAILVTIALFEVKYFQQYFGFLYGTLGRGLFIIFCGTMLLNKKITAGVGIGIVLIVVGFFQCLYVFVMWWRNRNKKQPENKEEKYESGMPPAAEPNKNEESVKKSKEKKVKGGSDKKNKNAKDKNVNIDIEEDMENWDN